MDHPYKYFNHNMMHYFLTDVDECTDVVTVVECGVNAHCVNLVGSFNCSCLQGYEGNATTLCESKQSYNDNMLTMYRVV